VDLEILWLATIWPPAIGCVADPSLSSANRWKSSFDTQMS